MSLRIYNTLSRELEEFSPLQPGQVRMYVCGMTVYDYCHLGHARSMIAFDVVQRWLKVSGFDVTYVPWALTIDAGSALSQALFEPLVHEGIDQNWVIEVRWSP